MDLILIFQGISKERILGTLHVSNMGKINQPVYYNLIINMFCSGVVESSPR
ncbi:hypothetical protein P278_10820 [Zhouia amylolytica AD3]|uniref:Uncharacterized protein n=1 Tax=Zhouia amylolytica AD3 TaxID=1286632 RepID=W2UMJ2_9FLAO|nr:hypothetical protein P278_10820 [Zhouia amylolytica AD3]